MNMPAQLVTDAVAYLVDGSTRTGSARRFEPGGDVLLGGGLARGDQAVSVPRAEVVALTLPFRHPAVPEETATLRTYDIHLEGGRVLGVRCEPGRILAGEGFWGWPEERLGMGGCTWFYRHGVLAVVRRTRASAVLMRKGLLTLADLR